MMERITAVVSDDDNDVDSVASHATTIIQSIWRRKRDWSLLPLRRYYLLIVKARRISSTLIHRNWIAYVERKRFLRLKKAVSRLQAYGRTHFFWGIPNECMEAHTKVLEMKVDRTTKASEVALVTSSVKHAYFIIKLFQLTVGEDIIKTAN